MVKDQAVRHYLADALSDALFTQPGATRLWTLLQALPPGLTCGPQIALETLAADNRFTRCVTRWDLTHRASTASRPLGGALEAILQAYGRPMPRALLVSELCLSRPDDPVSFEELLDRLLLPARDFRSFDDCLYLTRWLTNTAGADETGRLFINGLAQDDGYLALRPKLMAASLKQRQVLDTAEAVLKAAKEPLGNRGLGLLLHHHHGERFDAAEVLAALCRDQRFLALSGPAWTLATQEKGYRRTLAKEGGSAAELAPPVVDLPALLQSPPAQKLKLDESTLKQAQELTTLARTPVDLEELLSEVLALRPKQRNFAPAAHALHGALAAEMNLLTPCPGCYLSRRTLPPWVKTVPASLLPETVPLAPRERQMDVLLPLETLAPGLAEIVTNAFYEDEGETEVGGWEGEETTETMLALANHHYRCGTMKLRLRDRRLFTQSGPCAVVTFVTPQGRRLPIWINFETRLLYGFLAWYAEALPPAGALVTIRRDPQTPEVYHLQYEGETDPGTYLPPERLAQLQALRQRLRRKRPFLVDVVTALLQAYPKGLPFDQLWTQVNVIRRTTRLLLAGSLTVYPQFAGTGGRWKLVPVPPA